MFCWCYLNQQNCPFFHQSFWSTSFCHNYQLSFWKLFICGCYNNRSNNNTILMENMGACYAKTLSIMMFIIKAFRIMTISIKGLFGKRSKMSLGITTLCHNDECRYTDCHILNVSMLSVLGWWYTACTRR